MRTHSQNLRERGFTCPIQKKKPAEKYGCFSGVSYYDIIMYRSVCLYWTCEFPNYLHHVDSGGYQRIGREGQRTCEAWKYIVVGVWCTMVVLSCVWEILWTVMYVNRQNGGWNRGKKRKKRGKFSLGFSLYHHANVGHTLKRITSLCSAQKEAFSAEVNAFGLT